MLNRLGSLRFFLAVADEGGVRQAAHKCNISQPALTRHIQSLENELGVSLFDRTSRGMELTPFGEIVRHHALEVEFSCDDLLKEVGEIVDGTSGTLRISAGPGWSYSIVPQAIAKLQKVSPGILVDCSSELVGDSIAKLRAGEVDIVINRLDTLHDPGEELGRETLLTINHYIFAGRDHPLRSQESLGIRDLHAYPWITFRNSIEARSAVDGLFENADFSAPKPAVVTNSYQTCLNLLRSGPYLMVLPSTLAQTAQDQDVEVLPLKAELGSFPAGLMYRPSTTRLAYFNRFRDEIREVASEIDGTVG